MERLRFFDGQLLTSKDFQAEQDYQIEKRWLHNRMLHGFGVVDGLAVSIDDGPDSAVFVSPGFALDRLGREILVEGPVRVDLGTCTSDFCFVTIEFTEVLTHPVLAKNGVQEFSRVTEGYSVGIATDDPADSTNASQLCLARVIREDGLWLVDESYCPQRVPSRSSS
jgi:hypothetical protein